MVACFSLSDCWSIPWHWRKILAISGNPGWYVITNGVLVLAFLSPTTIPCSGMLKALLTSLLTLRRLWPRLIGCSVNSAARFLAVTLSLQILRILIVWLEPMLFFHGWRDNYMRVYTDECPLAWYRILSRDDRLARGSQWRPGSWHLSSSNRRWIGCSDAMSSASQSYANVLPLRVAIWWNSHLYISRIPWASVQLLPVFFVLVETWKNIVLGWKRHVRRRQKSLGYYNLMT